MRKGQTTVEYMLTISVVSIAIVVVMYAMYGMIRQQTTSLGGSLATSLTTDGVQGAEQ